MVRRARPTPYAVRLPNPGKHLYPPPLTGLEVEDFQKMLEGPPLLSLRAQLYLHLPFCETICTFCPIPKYQLTTSSPVSEYVEALKLELRALSKLPLIQQLCFDNIYFGGGTPSVIPDHHLGELMDLIQEAFTLDSPQITFEGHVRTLTREKLRFVRMLGFNRVSTGVQSFDPELRRMLKLTPTEDEIHRCIESARDEGFVDFNIDLMYNLPGQSLTIWEQDLHKAVSLDPSGMDIYETIIANRTPLYAQVKRRQMMAETDPQRLADSYRLAEEVLTAGGYQQKNLFVWDRPGFQNRLVGLQSQLRDQTLHIIGTGLSAYSLINGRPFINEARRAAYIARVHGTGHGVKAYHVCSNREEMERFMIMSLEEFRLDRDRFAATFGREMDEVFAAQLKSFKVRGLIETDDHGYRLTPLGRAWATTMTVEFFGGSVIEEILHAILDKRFFGGTTREEEFELPLFAAFHPQLLLKDWWDLGLIVAYLRFLRRADQRWLIDIIRRFARVARRYGTPAWIWFLSAAVKSLVRDTRPSIGRLFGARSA